MAGCVAKLANANNYRSQLKQSIDHVMPTREIRMIARRIDGTPNEYVVDAVPPDFPELVEWGVLLGDAVHDLRTPLDHLAWAMVIKHVGPQPPKPRQVQFPIDDETSDFRGRHIVKLLPAE